MRTRLHCFVILCSAALLVSPATGQDPFADTLVSFTPGPGAGFGSNSLPDIVLGPPRGAGSGQGSFDVVSLGENGVIVLRFDLPVICDGPGPDLTVFENPFHSGSPTGPVFEEFGIVAVSQDGIQFWEFPYDEETHAGLAGRAPVLSDPDNDIDPLDPNVSGGDQYDLADIGVAWAAYVRITDPGAAIPDPGNALPGGNQAGFDLDAIAAVNACEPGSTTATPTPTPSGPPGVTNTATATATTTPLAGDLDGDGAVTAADARRLIAELFDGDGDTAGAARGGDIPSGPAADVNQDGTITAADLVALTARRSQ